MSGYKFQFAAPDEHGSAFVGDAGELCFQGAVMTNEAFPKKRNVPFNMPLQTFHSGRLEAMSGS